MIAFIGSVFSPYYARAHARGTADPLDHCALNVALYGKDNKRWALTERRRASVERTAATLAIGPSAVHWSGDVLTIEIDERTFPIPSRIRGVVRVRPAALIEHTVALDAEGRHRWSPLAACARVEVELEHPALRWSGPGYLDANAGDEPIARAFRCWTWSRAATPDGTVILYDVTRRSGEAFRLALDCDDRGAVHALEPPPPVKLPRTGWGIARQTQADAPQGARVLRTLEDTPFYARSLVATTLYGQPVVAMHESLSLDRIRSGWVPWLLPFRMPRERR